MCSNHRRTKCSLPICCPPFCRRKTALQRKNLLKEMSHGKKSSLHFSAEQEEPDSLADEPLAAYTVNLNEEVRAGRIDPLIGRQAEMERVLQILCRRRKNNPLLVGEAGVGKTALAEGLAYLIEQGEVPEVLANATVFALDMGALLAGAKYRGDFVERTGCRARCGAVCR